MGEQFGSLLTTNSDPISIQRHLIPTSYVKPLNAFSAQMTRQPSIVAITGGTGSGKTALAEAIANRLGRNRVSLVSQDAYYRDRSDIPPQDRAALNFDVPEAFDLSLFFKHLRVLKSGHEIQAPVYSFESHTRASHTCLVRPKEVVLVDGLLLLFDSEIRTLFDLTVFVDVPGRIRFQRRLRRDVTERGRTGLSVMMQFLDTVQPAHEQYAEPTKGLADLLLYNTGQLEECAEIAVNEIKSCLHRRTRERRRYGHHEWQRT